MSEPRRIQLSRKKGWRVPANTVKVTRPGKWGNPFIVRFDPHSDYTPQTPAEAVKFFRASLGGLMRIHIRHHLRGKNLACWCKLGEPCHADVLLEIANK